MNTKTLRARILAASGSLVLGPGLTSCGEHGLAPTPPAPIAAAVTIVSGDEQEGTANVELGEPFVIQVTDAQGDGLGEVEVIWTITSGAGHFGYGEEGDPRSAVTARTGAGGLAAAVFTPTEVGTSTVTTGVAGLEGATFTIVATDLQIQFVWYFDSFFPADAAVPVGTMVVWLIADDSATVTSSSAPPGGAPFDSGILNLDDRFRFVPEVLGTWEYFDRVSGATATLTARQKG